MTIEEAVRDRVAEVEEVAALVGGRVYLLIAPQSPQYPYVLVQGISDVHDAHWRGPVALSSARVQIDAVAKVGVGDPYRTASAVLEAVIGDGRGPSATGLDGWVGVVGGSLAIRSALAGGRTPGRYEPGEVQAVTISQDFDCWYHQMT